MRIDTNDEKSLRLLPAKYTKIKLKIYFVFLFFVCFECFAGKNKK